jgi:hypothetical protein
MGKNDKILLGVGLGILAFYLLSRKKQNQVLQNQDNIKLSDDILTPLSNEQKPISISNNLSTPNNINNKIGFSNLSKQERDSIEVAKKSSNRNFTANDILVTSLGNFKYVLIRGGKRAGVSLGSPPIYDWVRTSEQPKTNKINSANFGSIFS